MDRALQERIIGAVVLVVLAILIVPVFLDGPSDDTEIISESVTLPGQNDQERQQQTIILDRDRTEPIPSTNNSAQVNEVSAEISQPLPQPQQDSSATPENQSEDTNSAPAEETPVQETQVQETADVASSRTADKSATGMWAVQLGSFSNEENADRLAADLRKAGYAAFLSQLQTSSGQLHRVRVGPQKDRDSAEAVAAALQRKGHRSQVVPHP